MKLLCLVIVSQLLLVSSIIARTFTIKNNCPYTIWPAIFTNPDSPTKITSQVAGWEAGRNSEKKFEVPNRWAGRFWGRTHCNFAKSGPASCGTGGCNGGLICDARTGSGVPPATLAEFKLNGDGGKDYYDISNVDGSNLRVKITNNVGCPVPSCTADLNAGCPDNRMKVKDSTGATIGCLSACQANLDNNHGNSANCCTGSHDKPATCPKQNVQHYNYFKGKCPDAYAYAYDESSQSALWTCSKPADYTVTFCP